MKKSRDLSFCLVALFIFVAMIVSIIITILSVNNIKLSDISKTSESIALDDRNFVDELIKNSKMKISNDYYLSNKITLGENEINALENAGDLTFYGTLDGKGNTIKVNWPMTKPLFSQISEDSTVKQLVIENAKVSNNYANSLAVLTNTNKGTIEFIKLSNTQVSVSGASIAGGIAAYNCHEIKYCVVSVFFEIDNDYTDPNQPGLSASWKCHIGAVAGINSEAGQIKSAIVSAKFSDNFVVLTRQQSKNDLVGYTVGSWGNENNISDIYIVDAQYVTTAHDIRVLYSTDGSSSLKLKSLDNLVATDFTNGDWNNQIYGWSFESGKLPILRTSQMLEANRERI